MLLIEVIAFIPQPIFNKINVASLRSLLEELNVIIRKEFIFPFNISSFYDQYLIIKGLWVKLGYLVLG